MNTPIMNFDADRRLWAGLVALGATAEVATLRMADLNVQLRLVEADAIASLSEHERGAFHARMWTASRTRGGKGSLDIIQDIKNERRVTGVD